MNRRNIWPTIITLFLTALVAIVGTPLYIHKYGFGLRELLPMLFFMFASGFSITLGYHRLYSHATFKANRFVELFVLFFGACAVQQSALVWSSLHRSHHRYVDTDKDPYNIKRGFFYAHMGWVMFYDHPPDLENALDLRKNRLVMLQHSIYYPLAYFAGLFLPIAVGAACGNWLGGLIFSACLRATIVYHSTFFINSVCHTMGRATYDLHCSARDHWFVALLTNGEGYHNFHHRFPTDYRNGFRWYHWDPTKWAINLLMRLGLARGLKRVSKFNILEARLAAENETLCLRLAGVNDPTLYERLREMLRVRHTLVMEQLKAWEATVRSYHLQEAAREQVLLAKVEFRRARRQWNELLTSAGFQAQVQAIRI